MITWVIEIVQRFCNRLRTLGWTTPSSHTKALLILQNIYATICS